MISSYSFISCLQNIDNENTSIKITKKLDHATIGFRDIISSKILNEDHQIIIFLPKGYKKNNSNYPLLYLTGDFQNIEHVRGSVEILTRNRRHGFTFSNNKNNPKSSGGRQFLEFIETELIPYIDITYRTNSFRVLKGHYLGGLLPLQS